jgi:hypothetical protein
MSLKQFFAIFFVIGCLNAFSQITYQNAFFIGSSASDQAYKNVVDMQGNIYLTGSISGVADFDPGLPTHELINFGETDAFLAKFDQNLQLLFAFSIGGISTDYGISLQIDSDNNIYIAGVFQGIVDFDPSEGDHFLQSNGDWDAFIAKYDSLGNLLVAFNIGGAGAEIAKIVLDHDNNIILAGTFQETVDFDIGNGVHEITAVSFSEIFIAKYTPTLDLTFVKSIGAQDLDLSLGDIAINLTNEIVITGGFYSILDFDPGDGTAFLSSSGYDDSYLARYSPSGDLISAQKIGGLGSESAYGIGVDELNNIYIIGNFTDSVDFNPGMNDFVMTPLGLGDMFLVKFNNAGEFINALSLGSVNGWNTAYQILIAPEGRIFLAGSFESTIDFDPGPAEALKTSNGASDIFLAHYDTDFNYVDAVTIGDSEYDYGYSCAVSPEGDVYITGSFSLAADFDPGEEEAILSSTGYEDIFLAKYTTTPVGTFQPAAADSSHDLTIFPNPVSEEVILRTGTVFQEAEVKIFDMSGLLICRMADRSGESLRLNIKDLPNGIYLIEVREHEENWRGKMVVSN